MYSKKLSISLKYSNAVLSSYLSISKTRKLICFEELKLINLCSLSDFAELYSYMFDKCLSFPLLILFGRFFINSSSNCSLSSLYLFNFVLGYSFCLWSNSGRVGIKFTSYFYCYRSDFL